MCQYSAITGPFLPADEDTDDADDLEIRDVSSEQREQICEQLVLFTREMLKYCTDFTGDAVRLYTGVVLALELSNDVIESGVENCDLVSSCSYRFGRQMLCLGLW